MKPSPFKLERFFAKYEHKVPYLLCSSDPESFLIKELLNLEPGSSEDFDKCWLGYMEAVGSLTLRTEISKIYNNIAPNETLVHAGAQEVIFVFMSSNLESGDHVIVHFPNYQSLEEVARYKGAEVTRLITKEEDNWEIDVDFIKQNIKKNTKAIIINCPHNPTGYLMSKEKLNEIVEIARKNNIIIFSDEVYRLLEYDEKDRLPAICDIYENGLSVGVMSKAFGLAGLRIGWAASKNKKILENMSVFKDYTTICSSAPSEFLATFALRNKEKILKRNRSIIGSNVNILNKFFDKHTRFFNWKLPKAGTIAFPSIKLDIGIERFCLDLIEKKGVFLLPSTVYDYGDKNFRIGFGRKNLPECLAKFEEYLIENNAYTLCKIG